VPRFSANVSLMYTEFPVVERFERAAESGFRAVEFLYPQDDYVAGKREVGPDGADVVVDQCSAWGWKWGAGRRG
jgi:hydroxypyruvate isomerase